MRFADLRDYLELRRHIHAPWSFLRLRKHRSSDPLFEIRFRRGFTVNIRPQTIDRHFFHRIFARDEYRLASLGPEPCECIVDVGGQIGLFAVRASPFARRVLTFEPMRDNFALLERNLAPARFGNVESFRAAVTDQSGTVTLHRFTETGHHSLYIEPEQGVSAGTEEVAALSLEQVFRDNGVERCDLLKLDCEGAEYPILYAAPDAVLARIRRIHMEYHGVDDAPEHWNGEALRSHLAGKGYEIDFLPAKHPPGRGFMFCRR